MKRASRYCPILFLLAFFLFLSFPLYSQSRRLQLSFVGDIMVHTANYLTSDYSAIYASIAPFLQRDDLSFANLEFPVDPSRPFSSYPRFNGTLEYLEAAVEAGIDVFSLANNHAFDQGRDGIFQTLRALNKIGNESYGRLHTAGTRGNLKVPFLPAEIRLKGVRIGFLAVCQMVNAPMPYYYVNIVDYRNRRHRDLFLPYIETTAAEYDLFILSYHGGREYSRQPEAEKMRFFETLLAAGVDIVWAHHPHVLQPYALVEREEGRGLIMPSTGNLISGMSIDLEPQQPENELSWTADSAVWLVSVAVENNRSNIEEVVPLPITNYRNHRGEVLVETFPGMAGKELPEEWQSYYRERARLLRPSLGKSAEKQPFPAGRELYRLAYYHRAGL
jgi:poly-gamma-glutamate capsule biosynthesis protein CapA/YwtB (metallophosphatase superfamily)